MVARTVSDKAAHVTLDGQCPSDYRSDAFSLFIMDREALIDALKAMNAATFLEEYVFDSVPHVFGGDRGAYIGWKRALGAGIDVDPACLMLIGSAAVGCSLNPSKNLKPFDNRSDIDVAVISNHYFTIAWRYLRMNGTRRLKVDQRTRNAWDEHVSRYIYWGTIATDKLLGVLPFGLEWITASSAMGLADPTKGRDVNLRIYADYEALRAYQMMSVKSVRENLYS